MHSYSSKQHSKSLGRNPHCIKRTSWTNSNKENSRRVTAQQQRRNDKIGTRELSTNRSTTRAKANRNGNKPMITKHKEGAIKQDDLHVAHAQHELGRYPIWDADFTSNISSYIQA
jgi:hypothetical protein